MTGFQIEAINRNNTHIKVRGNVIYMDPAAADTMVETLQKTETGDMDWRRVPVVVQLEAV